MSSCKTFRSSKCHAIPLVTLENHQSGINICNVDTCTLGQSLWLHNTSSDYNTSVTRNIDSRNEILMLGCTSSGKKSYTRSRSAHSLVLPSGMSFACALDQEMDVDMQHNAVYTSIARSGISSLIHQYYQKKQGVWLITRQFVHY